MMIQQSERHTRRMGAILPARMRQMFTGKGFWLSLLTVMALCLISTVQMAAGDWGKDLSQITISEDAFILRQTGVGYAALYNVWPLLLLLPFCFFCVRERHVGILPCILKQTGKGAYYYSGMVCCFAGSFLIFFIPFTVQIILNELFFQGIRTLDYSYEAMSYLSGELLPENYITRELPFLQLYFTKSQYYNLLYAGIFSLTAGVCAMLLYALSLFAGRVWFLVAALPYIVRALTRRGAMVSLFGIYLQVDLEQYIWIYGERGQSALYFALCLVLISLLALLLVRLQVNRDEWGGRY